MPPAFLAISRLHPASFLTVPGRLSPLPSANLPAALPAAAAWWNTRAVFCCIPATPMRGLPGRSKQYAKKWADLKLPVWPHLIVRNGYECSQMVRALENLENIGAIEVSLPSDAESSFIEEILQAALGELPLYVSVPFLSPWQNWLDLFRLYTVSGIVLSAPRGNLIINDTIISGRLYGPSLFPQLLEKITAYQGCGIPLVAGSGIFGVEQGTMALQAGASAVQLDACLWQLSVPTSPSKS